MNGTLLAKELTAGGIAGTVGVFIGIPLDFVKTRTQLFPGKYRSPIHCFATTLKNEGISGFYAGCVSPLIAQFFVNALAFAGESMTMRLFNEYDTEQKYPHLLKGCVSGGFGGFLTTLATVPTDLVKVRMQGDNASGTPKYRNTWHCVKYIAKTEGFLGFYRGTNVTIVREVPSFAAYFLAYDYTVRSLTPKGEEPATSSILIAGGCAGMSSWVPVYPMDVIKTYVQNNPQENSSGWQVAKKLYKRHGASVFWHGVGPVILRAFPVNGATFYCYEDLKKRFGVNKQY